MTQHTSGTRQEWLAARLKLLKAEKELTRRSDELAEQRQALPWVRIDKEYRFETDSGTATKPSSFGVQFRSSATMYRTLSFWASAAGTKRAVDPAIRTHAIVSNHQPLRAYRRFTLILLRIWAV